MKKLITNIEALLEHYTKETGLKITDVYLTRNILKDVNGNTKDVEYKINLSCGK
jgi:hypothetical protein